MAERKHIFNGKSLCMASILILFAAVFLWILLASDTENLKFDNEKPYRIDGLWEVSYGDTRIETALPAQIDYTAGETVRMKITLDDSRQTGNSLLFYAAQSVVKVYLDGEALKEPNQNEKTPFPMTPGSAWYFMRLPADWDGKELVIELESPFESYGGNLHEVLIGTKAAFLYMILKQGSISLLIGIPIIILGIALIFISLFLKKNLLGRRIRYLGLFAIVTSGWSILESKVTQLFAGNLTLAAYVLFSCFFLIPLVATGFLLTFESMAKSKYMRFVFWASAVEFAAVQLLQITGIFYYIEMVPIVHVFVILIIIGVIKSFAERKRLKSGIGDNSVYRAFLIFGVFAAVDIFRFYPSPAKDVGRYSRIGLLIFIIYLGYSAIKQASVIQIEETKKELYRQLAYTDILTGLPNRTSFEQEMESHRGKETEENLIIMLADVNNLKDINDNFGHTSGDRAIILAAQCLNSCFKDNCRCFRVGGDEFCVISRGLPLEDFENNFHLFEKKIEEAAKTIPFRLSVAGGYKSVGEAGIDEGLKEADRLMYENKNKTKIKK